MRNDVNNKITMHVHRKYIIFFTISLLCSLLTIVTPAHLALAQENNLKLAKTNYATREDLDILFANSTRVLEYLEGVEIKQPLFLSLITSEQEQNLKQSGFKLQILDEDADLSRYILLWHPQSNQAYKLSDQGGTFTIADHYTLLKLPLDKIFVLSGVAAEFFEIPFSKVVVTPPLRTKTVPTPTPTTLIPTSPPLVTPPPASEPIIKPILFILLYFGLGVILFLVLHKKGILPTRKHQLVYFSLLLIGYFTAFLLLRPDTGADIPIPPNTVF